MNDDASQKVGKKDQAISALCLLPALMMDIPFTILSFDEFYIYIRATIY